MVKILDTTLRDGSYVIDFQFTPKDTAIIGHALDLAGVDFIEIGHGLGMNAGSKPFMKSPASDSAYLEAAANSIKNTPWGMFFIPEIGRVEDIDMAAEYGMPFIRIGTDVDKSEKARKYIERAKHHGMYVAANFMKTYALTYDGVGQRAKVAKEHGADIVCIVDSAGGMLPSDVEGYFNAIRDISDVAIGFHGHNNLGLAMANTLRAVELGCSVVDTSIRGMGRSAGNAVTEMLLFILDRISKPHSTDVFRILKIAEEFIDPLLKNYQQVNSIGIVSGYAQFHSAYLSKIYQYSNLYGIDPKKLIIEVSKVNKIVVADEVVKDRALAIKNSIGSSTGIKEFSFLSSQYLSTEEDFASQLKFVLEQAHSLSKRHFTQTVLNVVQAHSGGGFVSQVINEGNTFNVVSAEIASLSQCGAINELAEELVDYVLLDCDKKTPFSERLIKELSAGKTKNIVRYSDTEVWAKSITSIIVDLSSTGQRFVKYGKSTLQENVESILKNYDIHLADFEECVLETEDYILVAFEKIPLHVEDRMIIPQILVDTIIGSISQKLLRRITDYNYRVIRPQMHPFILSELEGRLSANQRHKSLLGIGSINGISVASGGQVAVRGTVIVDDIYNPKKIFGVANGMGFLLKTTELTEKEINDIKNIETIISLKFLGHVN